MIHEVSGRHARRSAAVAVAAGIAITSTPAFAIFEAVKTLCPDNGGSGPNNVQCLWRRPGNGPVINLLLPASQQIFNGRRSIVGLIDGLLPRSSHEAFDDSVGGSRVLAEIASAGTLNEGNPTNPGEVALATRATGVLHTMIGSGQPQPQTDGVVPQARAYTASVATAAGANTTFAISENAYLASLLLMSDSTIGAAFGIARPADVIVMPFSYIGDSEGEGFLSIMADAVAFKYGMTLVAPTGDGGAGPFPPNNPDAAFRTVGSPASAFNVIKVGGFDVTPTPTGPPGFLNANSQNPRGGSASPRGTGGEPTDTTYNRAWNNPGISLGTGRGRLDVRNFANRDATNPSGFRTESNVRVGVDVVAPATLLRLATSVGDAEYSRDTAFPTAGTLTGSNSTAFAAGFVGGSVALLQDAFRALKSTAPQAFPQWNQWNRDNLPNVVVKAILLNSAAKSRLWTNQGNQGATSGVKEPRTQQPLDTIEGAGIVQLNNAFVQFQGRDSNGPLPTLFPTMDSGFTDPKKSTRIRRGAGTLMSTFDDPPIGIGVDPPLGVGGGGSNNAPSSGVLPPPDLTNPSERRRSPQFPEDPDAVYLPGAIAVRAIGWDYGKLGPGFIDYAWIDPVGSASDDIFATLCWNRAETRTFPTAAAIAAGNLGTTETGLQFDNLDLQVYLHDGSGIPRVLFGESTSLWNNVEHVVLAQPIPFGTGSLPLVRVLWVTTRYDLYRTRSVANVVYSVAWRLNQNLQANAGGGGGGAPNTPIVQRPGDLNADGVVNAADLSIVLQNYGASGSAGDANNDGVVDFRDLNLVISNFNR